jgi:methyl-accepting chemotaxis protein
MVAGEDQHGPTRAAATPRATFELERFAWAGPDRLQVSGRFTGLGGVPTDVPVLVVSGPERTHRLAALPDSLSGSLEDGSPWSAEFAWQEPPVAFDTAMLELGPGIVVELPEAGAKRRWIRGKSLEVRSAGSAASAESTPEQRDGAELGREPERQPENAGAALGAEQLRLEAELLAAHEEVRELRAAAERAREELTRSRADLTSERDGRAEDAERFRQGLASLQQSAAKALTLEQSALQQVEGALSEARSAIEAKEAELEQLRAQLEEAAAARAKAESDAQTAARALRDHLAGLREAGRAADKAWADGEHLLSRLQTIRDALQDAR